MKEELSNFKTWLLNEKLTLKRHEDKIAVVSDLETRADRSKETFKNKDKLKKAGFSWDSNLNSWTIKKDNLQQSLKTLNDINKIETFVEKFESLPEFLVDVDNFSKKDELSGKIDSFINSLASEIDEKAASDEIRRFLDFQAKLKSRSAYNTMLIWAQNQKATHVEGFRTWQNKYGRAVKKGAKAISILAPRVPRKDESDVDIDDNVKKRNVRFFISVNVFDVSDTEPIPGKEHLYTVTPEWHASDTPDALADKIFNFSNKLAEELGVKITRDDSRRGEQGWASGGHVNITSNIDGVNKAGTTIHEIAHELLHFKEKSIFHVDEPLTKQDKEIQAESVSYVVLKHYNLPVSHQSTYLALYKANKDSLKKSLESIKKVSDFIIKRIDEISKESQTI
jgi:hypothetical protein